MEEIIVSGSSGNLGTAVCARFMAGGFKVHAIMRPGHETHPLSDDLLKTHVLDLTKEQDCADFIAAFNPCPHIAVLCAGGFAMGDLASADGEALDKMITLNFKTAWHILHPLWQRWQKESIPGRAFVIGARPALEPTKGKSAIPYTLSKTLVIQLAQILSATSKTGEQKIFTCVPDILDTPENRKSMPDAKKDTWVKAGLLADWIYTIAEKSFGGFSQQVIRFYGK
jgi:NAD(P)-dependent dehydrogenase (short-subunit alcohol dehydrogenase family)